MAGCTKQAAEPPGNSVANPATEKSADAKTSILEAAVKLHEQGQPAAALKMVQQELIASPDDPQVLMLAAAIYQSLGDHCTAAEMGSKAADAESDSRSSVAIRLRVFDWRLRCGDFTSAESDLRRAMTMAPEQPQARRLLAQLLNAQGRRYEASEHVRELIRLQVIQHNELLSLVDLSGPFSLVSYDGVVDVSQPSLFLLGQARYQYVAQHENPDEVLVMLRRVIDLYPESIAALAFQGRVLAEAGRNEEFVKWHQGLPEAIRTQPEYWSGLGTFLSQQDRHREAIRACAEAVRLDPTNREPMRLMAHSLEVIGMESVAAKVRERLAILDKVFRLALEANEEQSLWISEQLSELSRPWESTAWLMHAAQLAGNLPQRVPELNRRGAAIAAWENNATSDQIRDAGLKRLLDFDIEAFPLPELKLVNVRKSSPSLAHVASALKFEDIAQQVGITTQFRSGFPVDGGEFFAHQVNGGGLAVLDYDLDGRCDLYVVQSGGQPNDPVGSTANQLFHGLPEHGFVEVTELSGAGDRGFGQGVCAGDVNQDGFPDLLVANIGVNTAYLNQGDGTFRQSDRLFSDHKNNWTSCLGLGDLDGDHLPDIVEVNYINDPQAYLVKCNEDHLPCQPQRFLASSDRVYRCREDGSFELWAPFAEIEIPPRLGFGLVIANFDRQYGNDFFVANDGDHNHFWISVVAPESKGSANRNAAPFAMVEAAGVRGCSVGRGGASQACMGVASGDFDRNGTLDLHVTNFTSEPVNLFLQTRSGFFSDEALKYGLVEPSFDVLGFGTQSADLDNDGWLDLVVLNGHVYDGRKNNIAYRMRPQLFQGGSQGFKLRDALDHGEYWQKEQLGRTLATLDWNRDGRIDMFANSLDQPISLIQNDSSIQNWVQLELVGVTSERDAIGAEVRVTADSQSWAAWQTGGDGYMCSNEAMIHVGIGDAQLIDKIEVTWPSGHVQTFSDVVPNKRYLIVEHQDALESRNE